MSKKIAVTIGDPYGIGPEVVAKALNSLTDSKLNEIVVIGARSLLKHFGMKDRVEVLDPTPSLEVDYKAPYRIDYAKAALDYINMAIDLVKNGQVGAVVTAPVNKEEINSLIPFCGHTEYFKRAFGVEQVEMFFASDEMNLVLMTRHIPLRNIFDNINARRLEEVIRSANEFRTALGDDRAIGVCALNPHAGEDGLMGWEEQEIYVPVILRLRQLISVGIEGPLPADTIFRRRKEFSVIVTSYHDQGLSVLKTIAMDSAVNVTWNLPVIRTSPCHGTGFDIRARNLANPSSMYSAIEFAWNWLFKNK